MLWTEDISELGKLNESHNKFCVNGYTTRRSKYSFYEKGSGCNSERPTMVLPAFTVRKGL
jgi:hypothetical protein